MNDTVSSKANLWEERINAFQESGLSRKDWCQQNGIPQSTFSYWIRKLQSGIPEAENSSRLVFAKLPSEQEIHSIGSKENAPVTVYLSEKIRIEIGSDCPARLMDSLLQALKGYA